MDPKEGRGSYETDEGGDQRNHFHSGGVQSLEPGIEQLHKGNHEGEGFPHTQDWPSRLLEVMQPVVNVKEWQRVSCRMGVTCWEMDLLEEQILNVRDRVERDQPEEERLFDVEEEYEKVPTGWQGSVAGGSWGTMEELVGLLEQMQVVQQALGWLPYSGAEDLLDLVGGEDWEAILGQLWMERDDALERQARLAEGAECSAGGYASEGPLYQERFPSLELRSLM